ncbi:hypothetical protein DFQ27_008280 [Actinomortierella ambigua]|uniref:Uncharacterized protein n=1 Tax=Actinomortierella ambigua TaxID=1343610 RepID=A0A9P6QG97_9FUNG|nr:hypothetical protein DFQ27_008280 [Actinomortierella ambigua]
MYARQPRGYLLRKIREGLDEAKEQYPTWDQQQVIDRWERALNTKFLFEIASCKFGIEHRVISNLCTIGIEREAGTSRIPNPQLLRQRKEAEEDYKQLIQRLNNSMRLCLRT